MPHCARTRARAGAALGVASEHHGQERSHAHRDGLVRANADCEGEPLAGPGPRPCGKALRGATGSARMAQARRDGTGPRRLLSSKPPFPVRFLRLCALGTPKRARSAAWRMSRNQATSILRLLSSWHRLMPFATSAHNRKNCTQKAKKVDSTPALAAKPPSTWDPTSGRACSSWQAASTRRCLLAPDREPLRAHANGGLAASPCVPSPSPDGHRAGCAALGRRGVHTAAKPQAAALAPRAPACIPGAGRWRPAHHALQQRQPDPIRPEHRGRGPFILANRLFGTGIPPQPDSPVPIGPGRAGN